MNPLESFTIPVKGLKEGIYEFEFKLNAEFFNAINHENSVRADIDVKVSFDKRPSMYILEIDLDGYRLAPCDRCLEEIPVPVKGEHTLYIKRGVAEDEADVVYLREFDDMLNIAKFIYDYAVLSFPLMNIMDCDNEEKPLCNFEILEKWEAESTIEKKEETKTSIWDELNNLNLDN